MRLAYLFEGAQSLPAELVRAVGLLLWVGPALDCSLKTAGAHSLVGRTNSPGAVTSLVCLGCKAFVRSTTQ